MGKGGCVSASYSLRRMHTDGATEAIGDYFEAPYSLVFTLT